MQKNPIPIASLIAILVLSSCQVMDANPWRENSPETLPEVALSANLPSASDTFGALGCSMTRDVFDPGLSKNTSLDAWKKVTPAGGKVLRSYSGGTIGRWGVPGANGYSIKWAAFDLGVAEWGADVVIWQICTTSTEVRSDPSAYASEVEHIYGRIRAALPNADVYITGLPSYAPGHVCSITGESGVAFSHDLAAYTAGVTGAILADGLVLGPLTGYLLSGDGCHASNSGAEFQAVQFTDWING